MAKTLSTEMRLLSVVIIVLVASLPVGAQHTTPWGDPNLQGVWTNQTPTPVERPEGLNAFFTEEEAAEFEDTALERLVELVGGSELSSELELSGEFNEIWLETQHGKVSPSRRTSLVVDPPDGRIPYSPAGRRRWEAKPTVESILINGPLPASGPEDRTEDERCITTEGLLIPNPFYNNYHHIVQTPDHVAILTEMMHEVRIIPLDRRGHPHPNIGQWLGDSHGWWEGQTLVVETTNFNDKKLFRGATDQLRLVERFTRLDADTVNYQLTVTDPATFATPWTLENALRRAEGPVYEVACHEGNRGLAGILSGARAEERQ